MFAQSALFNSYDDHYLVMSEPRPWRSSQRDDDGYGNPLPPSPPLQEAGLTAPGLQQQQQQARLPSSGTSDRIGDTVFSKAWVLSLLVRAVRYTEEGDGEKEEEEEEKGGDGEREESQKCNGVVCSEEEGGGCRGNGSLSMQGEEVEEEDDLDAAFEEKLCLLWDASMNSVRNSLSV